MSSIQDFVCYDCMQFWQDKYSFWYGYQSTCPACGKPCDAVRDTQVYADQQEWKGVYDAPLFTFEDEDFEKAEADLEAERGQIRDEIAEALGMADVDQSEGDEDGDQEADDSRGDDC